MIKKINKKGLTILEVLVAITIVTVAVGSVVHLLVRSSRYSIAAETRGIAVAYAQEAIDVVKNVRDNQYCKFFNSSGPGAYSNNQFYRVVKSGVDVNIIERLNFDNANNAINGKWEYKYTAGSAEAKSTGDLGYGPLLNGGMRRSIYMQGITGVTDTNRKVTIEVQWIDAGSGTTINSYKMITEIYKWKY